MKKRERMGGKRVTSQELCNICGGPESGGSYHSNSHTQNPPQNQFACTYYVSRLSQKPKQGHLCDEPIATEF